MTKLTKKQETVKHNLALALLQLQELRTDLYGDRSNCSEASDNGDIKAFRIETAINKLVACQVDLDY